MSISANAQITLINMSEAYTVLLTNESQQFPTNSSRVPLSNVSYYTDIVVYQGSTERTDYTIGTVSSSNNITVSQTASRVTFTVSTSSTISSDSGTFTIPITIDGQTFNKIFSWSCAKQGATGTSAKSVDIVASSQVFKSTDGGSTFSPDAITLTPVFQGGISYSKWQYSTNGSTWTDVTSGSHGLTISSGVLSIAKTSDLFTETVTSISFKCISSNSTYYDIMTVLKLYDVTDIEIGGRNLIINSSRYRENCPFTNTSAAKDGYLELPIDVYMPCVPGETYTFQCKTDGKWGNHDTGGTGGGKTHLFVYLQTANEVGTGNYAIPKDIWSNKYYNKTGRGVWTYTIPTDKEYVRIIFRFDIHSDGNTPYTVNWWDLKAELGNKATDWTPAPEDIQNQITTITDTISGVESKVNANTKSITDKVWQDDITNSINNYDSTTTESIRSRVSQVEQDVNGIKSTVSDVQTTLTEKADGSTVSELTEKVSTLEQDANGFKQTVEKNYVAKADLNISSRNLLRNSKTLIFDSYGYGSAEFYYTDEDGNILTDENDNILII